MIRPLRALRLLVLSCFFTLCRPHADGIPKLLQALAGYSPSTPLCAAENGMPRSTTDSEPALLKFVIVDWVQ